MTERWMPELELATTAVRDAGRATLRWFQARAGVEWKRDGSPVTEADREAERLIRAAIRDRFPDDGILGEEGGEEPGGSGRRWLIDPVDGTKSFIRGVPLYGVMVGLEADGEAVLGALAFPALDEIVAAARGLGCTWNGRSARVSDVARLDHALVLTSGDAGRTAAGDRGPLRLEPLRRRLDGLARVGATAGVFRTWGDAYGYALVATGRAEAMLDPVVEIWDTTAVRPIIEEAGGVFTDWDGATRHEAGHAVGTNAAIADAVRTILRET